MKYTRRDAAFTGRAILICFTLFAVISSCPIEAQNIGTSVASQSLTSPSTNSGVTTLRPPPQVDRVADGQIMSMSGLPGHVPSWARPSNLSATPVSSVAPLQILLLLRRSPDVEAAFEQLLADQQTPGSPVFHQSVAPSRIGSLYGPTLHDIEAIKAWAQSEGLTVGKLSPTHMTLELKGTTTAVESALRVHFNNYTTAQGLRQAPDSEPQVPGQLVPVVAAIGGLVAENAKPLFTGSQGNHFITPADFAVIYDVTPTYNAGNTGATIGSNAQHIAVLGDSDANLTQVQAYFAGISNYSPSYNVIFADGTDPGYGKGEGEAELDLERVLGTAPGATVDLVLGNSNRSIYDAASYAVNVLQDPVVTMSFGACEANLTSGQIQFWTDVWSTAAANMTSVFVSGGDAGAADCDDHGSAAPTQQSKAVNGFASTIYNVAVGGTEFNEGSDPTRYWSQKNNGTTKASALSYIPESAWNDPVDTTNGTTTYLVRAGGGGASLYVTKPAWQVGPGVPNDGYRDMPDVALSASPVHDPYYVCERSDCTVAKQSDPSTFGAFGGGGTSAAAPSMAAIAALLNTAAGASQGNLNPVIYRLANSSVASLIFHDVTLASSGFTSCDLTTPSNCNNSTPGPSSLGGGQEGYAVGDGYDQTTGWGSIDVANFIKAAVQPATTLQITSSGTALSLSQTVTVTATLTALSQSLAPPSGFIQFYENGVPSGGQIALSNGAATSAAISFMSTGSYAVTAMYSGDALYLPSTSAATTILVAAGTPGFGLVSSPSSLSFTSGATSGNASTVTVTGMNNYVGDVALTCSITSSAVVYQPTCSVAPSTVTLGSNGSAPVTLTIGSTTAHAGVSEPYPAHPSQIFRAGAGLLAAFSIGGLILRRRHLPSLMAMILLTGGLFTIGGCSNGTASAPLKSSAGAYTVTISGAGKGTGALTTAAATTQVTVLIN